MFNQDTLNRLEAGYQATAKPSQQPVKKKNSGIKGYLSSLISEAGGTGGALGGATLGASIGSVVPGIGTAIGGVLGAGLGGFLGGTGGRVIENKVRDNRIGLGDALKEGAVDAVTSAGPLKLLKGAGGAVKGAAKGATAGEEVLQKSLPKDVATVRDTSSAAINGAKRENRLVSPLDKTDVSATPLTDEAIQLPGKSRAQNAVQGANDALQRKSFLGKLTGKRKTAENLQTQGQQMQARGLGISGGNKAAGKELTPQDSERMLSTLKNEGIKTGNANTTSRDLNNKLNEYGSQIADHFKTNDHPLLSADTKVVADNFLGNIKTTDPGVLKQAQIIADDLQKNVKSTKDLWDFRKSLDDRIPDTKQGNTLAVSNKIEAVKSAREYIAKELGNVPGMQQYHDLSEIKPFLGKGMRELNQPGGGIVGRVLSSGPVQKAESLAGKVVEGAGNVGAGGVASKVGGTANFASRILGAKALTDTPSLDQPQVDPNAQQPDMSTGILDDGSDVTGAGQPENDPFSPANVQANVQAILKQGGKMKDVSEYLANVKSVQELTASSGSKPISATAADAIANAKAGIDSLSTIRQELAANPGVQGKEAFSQVANPFGITSRLTGTGRYDSALTQAKDTIARLRTGAAISNSEEKRFTAMLPQPADSADVVDQKLTLLENALNTVVTRVGGNSDDLLQEAAAASQ